jgi:hypothetical protein
VLFALGVVLVPSGCSDDVPTSVLLTIRAESGVAPRSLNLWLYEDTTGRVIDGRRLPETGEVELPSTLVLYPPAKRGLRILVRGVDATGAVEGEGVTEVVPVAGTQVQVTVVLASGRLPDSDGDGVPDAIDNCIDRPNPAQGPCGADASIPEAGADGGVDLRVDGPPSDLAPDGTPDLGPDSGGDGAADVGLEAGVDAARDLPIPDVSADLPKPDAPKPDLPKPDVLSPDVLSPDVLAPDVLSPDSSPPGCALVGPYTIGSSTTTADFSSFSAAFSKLKSCGVSGPTTFTVASGTYTEPGFNFPAVPYASPTATVSFVAQGAVRLVGTNSSGKYVIQIDRDAHDLVLAGFEIDGTESANQIKPSYAGPVLFHGSAGQRRVVLRELYIHDFGPTAWTTNTYLGAVYMQLSGKVEDIRFEGCRFDRIEPPSSFHTQGAISMRYGTRAGVEIIGCEFVDIRKMDAINIRAGTHSEPMLIANNVFVLTDAYGAVEFYSSPTLQANTSFVFNTVLATTGTARGLRGSVNAASTAGVVVRNNIFRGPSSGSAARLVGSSLPLLAPGHNCIGYASAGYSGGSNDVLALPPLVDISGPTYDLHSASGSPCLNKGTPISVVITDIDGQPRSSSTPDIGADER